MKRSKLLSAIAIFYGAFALLNLISVPETLARHDAVYISQAFLGLSIHVGLAIGLFMQKKWVIPLFIASSMFTIALSWFWLKANPPSHFYWGTIWLVSTFITLFPGSLMFLRRARLKMAATDDIAGVF